METPLSRTIRTGTALAVAFLSASGPAAAQDAANGAFLYGQICAVCHGSEGGGGTGPSLKGLSQRFDAEAAATFIMHPSPKMPAFYPQVLSERDVKDIAAFVIDF